MAPVKNNDLVKRVTEILTQDRQESFHQLIDDDEGDIGPKPQSRDADRDISLRPKIKRRKIGPNQKLFLERLPKLSGYVRSYMHGTQLSTIHTSAACDFLVTASSDGATKLWKKQPVGIEFVKQFRATAQPLNQTTLSIDGSLYATSCSTDNTIKVFDILNFDLFNILNLNYRPQAMCWVHRKGSASALLAVAEQDSSTIRLYDPKSENDTAVLTKADIHTVPVVLIAFNSKYDCCVSIDRSGSVEYWTPDASSVAPKEVFKAKGLTDLYEFRKSKAVPTCLTISPNNESFATISYPDRQVRLFNFASGKLIRKYDESLATAERQHQSGTAITHLDDLEFGRRLAIEREFMSSMEVERSNVIFDESGLFLLYSTLFGIKVINTYSNTCVKAYAQSERLRPVSLALYQGTSSKAKGTTMAMAASENPLLAGTLQLDPVLFATSYKSSRFYMFANVDLASSKAERDIFNEKPEARHPSIVAEEKKPLPNEVSLFTSAGDIVLQLYPQQAPKAVENFTTHCKTGYYDGTIFHRVIPQFMIQGGDPKGDGSGGTSIWGKGFRDEVVAELRHDKPYVLSMANAGPSTNGSQFFITTDVAKHLDGKHTIFGRVVQGMDIVHLIEMGKTGRLDRPTEPVSIHSTAVK